MGVTALVLLVGPRPVSGQRILIGDIGGQTLTAEHNPYVIREEALVPEGKTTIVESGTVLLFEDFSTLRVLGSLKVNGEPGSKVIFTSINSRTHNPNSTVDPTPFDWNGVYIDERARGIEMSYFLLEHAVFGLKSMTEDIRITSGAFGSNGQFNFTIDGSVQPVTERIPYSHNVLPKEPDASSGSTQEQKPRASQKKPVSLITGIALGAVGLGAGAAGFLKSSEWNSEWELAQQAETEEQKKAHEEKSGEAYPLMIAGYAGGGVCLAGAAIATVVYLRGQKKPIKVSGSVMPDRSVTVVISLNF